MRTISPTLAAFLNAARASDAPIWMAEAFAITLANGQVLLWSTSDLPFVYNALTYSASGPMIQGLKSKTTAGLEVDSQQVVIMARPTDLVGGEPFLQLVQSGGLDGAKIARDRVFFTGPPWSGGAVVGGVNMFTGRVATVDEVGRTTAKITVKSGLVLLDFDLPRNQYLATCNHVLYDAGCGLSQAAFQASGAVGAGSSASVINSTVALVQHAQGKLTFTSGANNGISVTVKAVVLGASFLLMYPMPSTPIVGDTFIVAFGCDHTKGTCQARFNNLSNFRGFPFVPPPELAI